MRKLVVLAIACGVLVPGLAVAQEHITQGPMWECSGYRTKPGQYSNYMEFLRTHYLPMTEAGKEAGLIVDYKVFVQPPSDPNDWNILICTLYEDAGAAMDFNADNDKKWDELAAAHYKTDDEDEQMETLSSRFEMRTFTGTNYVREVTLKALE